MLFDFSDKSEHVCQSSHCYELTMYLTMQDSAFLVKCYYKFDSNKKLHLQWYHSVRGIFQVLMTPHCLRKMMAKFAGIVCNLLHLKGEGKNALAVEKATMDSTHNACSVRAVTRRMDVSWSIVYKIISKVLQFYLYKIIHNQEFQQNILLQENLCLWNPVHWWKWTNIGHGILCGQIRPTLI